MRAYTSRRHALAAFADVQVESIEREAVDVKIVWDAAQHMDACHGGQVLVVTEDHFALALASLEKGVQHAALDARLDGHWREVLGTIIAISDDADRPTSPSGRCRVRQAFAK